MNFLSFLIALTIVLVNKLLAETVPMLTAFEKHVTLTYSHRSTILKLTLVSLHAIKVGSLRQHRHRPLLCFRHLRLLLIEY